MNVKPKRPIEETLRIRREQARVRYSKNKEAQKKRAASYRERNPDIDKRHRLRVDPVKERARVLLREAVRYGKIIKPTNCQSCGATGTIHGHHTDYSMPYLVMWLCPPCHGKQHRLEGNNCLAVMEGRA